MAGLTTEGFVPKTYDEVLGGFEARQRADIEDDIGEELDLSEFSLLGQLNRIVANDIAELWELGSELYDMLDPDKVTGAQQDALYSMTNTLREAARPSTVTATVNLSAGASIAVGDAVASVVGSGARFKNAEPMVNPGGSPANFPVLFESEETGAISAPMGQLTVRETTPTGWNSITNGAAADLGHDDEADALYRQRRVEELGAEGGGTVLAIRAELLQVPNVIAAQVLENDSDVVDDDGVPPHAIEAIVQGGDDEAIVAVLWENRAAGIQAFGTEGPFEVLDPDGNPHSIAFSRPTGRRVYLAFEIETSDLYTGDAAFKLAIQAAAVDQSSPAYLAGGAEVYAARFVMAAMEIAGVLNARVGLSLIAPITDPDDGQQRLDIAAREIATVGENDVDVAVTP